MGMLVCPGCMKSLAHSFICMYVVAKYEQTDRTSGENLQSARRTVHLHRTSSTITPLEMACPRMGMSTSGFLRSVTKGDVPDSDWLSLQVAGSLPDVTPQLPRLWSSVCVLCSHSLAYPKLLLPTMARILQAVSSRSSFTEMEFLMWHPAHSSGIKRPPLFLSEKSVIITAKIER